MQSYSTLANNLKQFAQFAHLRGYVNAQRKLRNPEKISLNAQRKLRNLRTVCANAHFWLCACLKPGRLKIKHQTI